MGALAVVGASWVAAACGANRVYGAEAGRGQGDEHLGVIGHGGGDVVVSTAQAGVDELPGVTGVQIRARRADRGASVVAAGEDLVFAAGSSRPARWIGLAQNPTASTRCHQALNPAERARRIIWATTASWSAPSGRPGKCTGVFIGRGI